MAINDENIKHSLFDSFQGFRPTSLAIRGTRDYLIVLRLSNTSPTIFSSLPSFLTELKASHNGLGGWSDAVSDNTAAFALVTQLPYSNMSSKL
ncbi:hypothetical protein N7454_003501 [Penicillium verhagenii]|nr:hypothetical protein N7454_003501 [Penicillium verhagenii]